MTIFAFIETRILSRFRLSHHGPRFSPTREFSFSIVIDTPNRQVTSYPGLMSFDSKTVGILAALGCAASWAMGAVLFKRLSEHLSSPGMALVKSFIAAG